MAVHCVSGKTSFRFYLHGRDGWHLTKRRLSGRTAIGKNAKLNSAGLAAAWPGGIGEIGATMQAKTLRSEPLRQYLAQWLTLTREEAATLAAFVLPCSLAPDTVFVRQGSHPCDEALLLTSGLVRAFYVGNAKEINLRLLAAPAAALPYNSFLLQEPADESLQALTAVEGYRIKLRAYCRQHPGLVAEKLQRLLAERHFLALQRRLRMLQGRSAAERYELFLRWVEPEIISRTPGYHVASYLGITPESLSRVRSESKKCQ